MGRKRLYPRYFTTQQKLTLVPELVEGGCSEKYQIESHAILSKGYLRLDAPGQTATFIYESDGKIEEISEPIMEYNRILVLLKMEFLREITKDQAFEKIYGP